jgi:flavin reductase (DIM6/NTAB) family NADH-FMN oxidoreductase RutF/rubredoxin
LQENIIYLFLELVKYQILVKKYSSHCKLWVNMLKLKDKTRIYGGNMDNKVMYKISYGLYLIFAKDGDKDNACISNTVMQITTTPNRITLCLNKQNFTHDMIMNTKKFNISNLSTETPFDVFKTFGFQSGKTVDKFAQYKTTDRAVNGILFDKANSNSYISATVIDTVDVGTHTMFIADVVDGEVLSDKDSLTYEYYHKFVKPAPQKTVKKSWRCKICGYIYEGDPLPADFICPICKHGAIDFEKNGEF